MEKIQANLILYKVKLLDFFATLTMYDYGGFAVVFMLFILFLVLALIARKRVLLSILLILLAFGALFAGPYVVYTFVHSTLYKSSAKVTTAKKLHYTKTLVVKGEIHYLGKVDATRCKVRAKVFKKGGGNFVKSFANTIKPYKTRSTDVNKSFTKGATIPFKILVEPFKYEGDFNITLQTECFK